MFSFANYAWEIWTVSKENGVDIGVAYDMFRADVRAGKSLPYNTGNTLPDFDFAAAKDEWDALSEGGQSTAYDEWHEFVQAMYDEICAAFIEGEDAVIALVTDWRDSHENN